VTQHVTQQLQHVLCVYTCHKSTELQWSKKKSVGWKMHRAEQQKQTKKCSY